MNFHEAQQGQAFFHAQLPQLIKSIQALTEAMSRPQHAVLLPVQADPDFLSDLYLGNYQPDVFNPAFINRDLVRAVEEAHTRLVEVLPENRLDILEQYADALAEQNSVVAELAYESGFRTAVQMILAGLSLPSVSLLEEQKGCHES